MGGWSYRIAEYKGGYNLVSVGPDGSMAYVGMWSDDPRDLRDYVVATLQHLRKHKHEKGLQAVRAFEECLSAFDKDGPTPIEQELPEPESIHVATIYI